MPPMIGYDPIATVQQAITALLQTQEPAFIAMGTRMFLSFATILLVWHGIRMMLTGSQAGVQLFTFARLLLVIAFGYAMIAYYEAPIPGMGVSFSNLITDHTAYLASLISARSVQETQSPFELFPRQQENVSTGSGFVSASRVLKNSLEMAAS